MGVVQFSGRTETRDVFRDAAPIDVCRDAAPIDVCRDVVPIHLCRDVAPIDLCRDAPRAASGTSRTRPPGPGEDAARPRGGGGPAPVPAVGAARVTMIIGAAEHAVLMVSVHTVRAQRCVACWCISTHYVCVCVCVCL